MEGNEVISSLDSHEDTVAIKRKGAVLHDASLGQIFENEILGGVREIKNNSTSTELNAVRKVVSKDFKAYFCTVETARANDLVMALS